MPTPNLPSARPRILVQAIGNPSRGDDALGPQIIEELEKRSTGANVEFEWVYQLQVEQAEQWSHFDLVIVVDAHVKLTQSLRWTLLEPDPKVDEELGVSSHQVSPRTVLALNHRYFQRHPQVYQLALCAQNFELGEDLSEIAKVSLAEGVRFLTDRLACDESTSGVLHQPAL